MTSVNADRGADEPTMMLAPNLLERSTDGNEWGQFTFCNAYDKTLPNMGAQFKVHNVTYNTAVYLRMYIFDVTKSCAQATS